MYVFTLQIVSRNLISHPKCIENSVLVRCFIADLNLIDTRGHACLICPFQKMINFVEKKINIPKKALQYFKSSKQIPQQIIFLIHDLCLAFWYICQKFAVVLLKKTCTPIYFTAIILQTTIILSCLLQSYFPCWQLPWVLNVSKINVIK